MNEKKKKDIVRKGYAGIAEQKSGASCCGGVDIAHDISEKIGYTDEELSAVPEGSNLGLGCGNPVALATLREGETVLDLGSGAGFDCFLTAQKVGKSGKVIGVDMTPEMIEKGRENARKGNYSNVEFRLGDIEKLPVADNSVDVVISNCVINLTPDKRGVFEEVFRVLKPGGRMMISDVVLIKELPDFIKCSIEAYVGCLAGASMKDEYIGAIKASGFEGVRVIDESSFPIECMANDPMAQSLVGSLSLTSEKIKEIASSVSSIKIYGIKPRADDSD